MPPLSLVSRIAADASTKKLSASLGLLPSTTIASNLLIAERATRWEVKDTDAPDSLIALPRDTSLRGDMIARTALSFVQLGEPI
jgi:hypothetical protein